MTLPTIKEYFVGTIIPGEGLGSTQGALLVTVQKERFQVVIKPRYKPGGLRIGLNELIASLLGRMIDAPVLEPLFVTLLDAQIKGANLQTQIPLSGRCFGTKYISGTIDGDALSNNDNKLRRVNNPEQAIPILLLDAWVNGRDHLYNRNLLFAPDLKQISRRNPIVQMYSIDYGLAFTAYNSPDTIWGSEWTIKSLGIAKNNGIAIDPSAEILIKLFGKHRSKLNNYLEKVEIIKKEDLVDIMSLLPVEWGTTEAEKDALVRFLLVRQKLLRPFFEDF